MDQNKRKRVRLMRFIGIVCWFLALFMLMDGRKDEQPEEEKNAIVNQVEMTEDSEVNTLIMPSND